MIKSLRKELGLTQQKFADKFGIPLRTVANWEYVNDPADYMYIMLKKVIGMEKLHLTTFVFIEYRDSAGMGSTKMFPTIDEAIQYAQDAWDNLGKADQNTYINDKAGEFCVAEVPVEWDNTALEFHPITTDYTPFWRAFSKVKEK